MHNIDINKTIDSVKLKFYHEWLATHIYAEGDSGFHKEITTKVFEIDKNRLNVIEGDYQYYQSFKAARA